MKTTGTALVKKALYTIKAGGLTIGMLGVLSIPALTPAPYAQNQSGYFGQGNAMAMAAIAETEIREQENKAAGKVAVALKDEKEHSTGHEADEAVEN